jgi:hypothetical protein
MSIFDGKGQFEDAFNLFLSQKIHLLPDSESKFLIVTACMSPQRRKEYAHIVNFQDFIKHHPKLSPEQKEYYSDRLDGFKRRTRIYGWAEWFRKEISDLGLKTGLQTGGKGFDLT